MHVSATRTWLNNADLDSNLKPRQRSFDTETSEREPIEERLDRLSTRRMSSHDDTDFDTYRRSASVDLLLRSSPSKHGVASGGQFRLAHVILSMSTQVIDHYQ